MTCRSIGKKHKYVLIHTTHINVSFSSIGILFIRFFKCYYVFSGVTTSFPSVTTSIFGVTTSHKPVKCRLLRPSDDFECLIVSHLELSHVIWGLGMKHYNSISSFNASALIGNLT